MILYWESNNTPTVDASFRGEENNHVKGTGMLDFGLTWGIQNRTPIFLATEVLFRAAREEIRIAIVLVLVVNTDQA